jgi:hypothetical protein
MSYTARYTAAVQEAEAQTARKESQSAGLRRLYAQQGLDAIAAQSLIDKDQIVQEAQLLHERAVARAAMYGPGAILEAMRR